MEDKQLSSRISDFPPALHAVFSATLSQKSERVKEVLGHKATVADALLSQAGPYTLGHWKAICK
jgi:hypothetical protein